MNKIKNLGLRPQKLSGIPLNLLEAYVFWQSNTKHIPKILRHSMGVRIDSLFAEIVELVSTAIFTSVDKKMPFVNKANTRNDVLKFMLNAIFELKGIKEDVYTEISHRMEEIGRQLYGWKMRIESENPNGSTVRPVEPFQKDKK
jgi:hypothetical protein